MKEGRCFKCGEKGHMARDCPYSAEELRDRQDKPRF